MNAAGERSSNLGAWRKEGGMSRGTLWNAVNKERHNAIQKRCRAKRRDALALSREYDEVMSSSEGDDSYFLYLMRYEFDPCGTMGIKVGRTKNLAARVEGFEEGHNFRMKVLRVYKGLGNLEPIIHRLLASKRASGGPGREWFEVSFATAMKAVALARALGPGDDLHEAASALSEELSELSEESPGST